MDENNNNNWSIKRVLQLIMQVAVLGYIVYYIFSRRGELARLWNVNLIDAVVVLALIFVGDIIRSYQLCYIVSKLDSEITITESFLITTASTLLNYLPMNAGTIAKARMLKKHRSLKYAHFVSVMGATILITIFSGGVLGLTSIIISRLSLETNNIILVGFFVLSIIVPIALLYIPASLISDKPGWVRTAMKDLVLGLEQIRKNGKGLLVLFLLATTLLLIAALRLWICFEALNTPVTIFGCIMFAVVSNLLLIINITPGSLGLREVLIGAIAQFTGLSFERGLFAASLDRVFSLVFAILVGLPSLVVLKIKKMI